MGRDVTRKIQDFQEFQIKWEACDSMIDFWGTVKYLNDSNNIVALLFKRLQKPRDIVSIHQSTVAPAMGRSRVVSAKVVRFKRFGPPLHHG